MRLQVYSDMDFPEPAMTGTHQPERERSKTRSTQSTPRGAHDIVRACYTFWLPCQHRACATAFGDVLDFTNCISCRSWNTVAPCADRGVVLLCRQSGCACRWLRSALLQCLRSSPARTLWQLPPGSSCKRWTPASQMRCLCCASACACLPLRWTHSAWHSAFLSCLQSRCACDKENMYIGAAGTAAE